MSGKCEVGAIKGSNKMNDVNNSCDEPSGTEIKTLKTDSDQIRRLEPQFGQQLTF